MNWICQLIDPIGQIKTDHYQIRTTYKIVDGFDYAVFFMFFLNAG